MKLFDKLKHGLQKTSLAMKNSLSNLFEQRKLDENYLERIEEVLLSSDVGIELTEEIISELSQQKFSKGSDKAAVQLFLQNKIESILIPASKSFFPFHTAELPKPYTVLFCGVNGSGKTTTIGKLAHKLQDRKIVLGACDTFRSAALEQLEVWGHRAKCELVSGNEKSDPASIAYRALEIAKKNKADFVFLDTAGRLHNKINLMNELEKCVRVLQKLDSTTPHETILVLDGTTGQNALNQVKLFNAIAKLSGIIITKLDSTSKGGIVLSIAKKHNIPIYAVGLGEGVDDLIQFSPTDFAKTLIDW